MDFKRPARSQRERTGREDRRLKFYGLRDNLTATESAVNELRPAAGKRAPTAPAPTPGCPKSVFTARHYLGV